MVVEGRTDAMGGNALQEGDPGVVVVGAKKRAEQLDGKKFVNGGFRDSHKVTRQQPRGGAGRGWYGDFRMTPSHSTINATSKNLC